MGRVVLAGLVVAAVLAATGSSAVGLTQIATDPYVNPTSQHRALVEPDSFAFGSTIVAAVQAGRFYDGGASNIEWATSTNTGGSWTSGALPGTTTYSTPPGPYARLTDPSVAYDAMHGKWMIASLALDVNITGVAAIVNTSSDGLTWSNPVVAAAATGLSDFDKDWIVCDNTPTSPFYGSCYVQYDDFGLNNQVHVAYTRDGGATWAEGAFPEQDVIGGQPVVQPNGTIVMPINDGFETRLLAYTSKDGGATWKKPKRIANVLSHVDAGDIRGGPLPTAEIDGSGRVFVAWADCRFRKKCSANDIVFSVLKGSSWSGPKRIPIAAKNGIEDDFIPGLAVDPTTSGKTTRLGLVYHYFTDTDCSSCELNVGFVSSIDGGSHWSAPVQLAGPMTMSWLPQTSQGRMVGDYVSASFAGGKVFPVFVIGAVPTAGGPDCETATPDCDVSMYTASAGITPSAAAHHVPTVVEAPVVTGSAGPVQRQTSR